MNSSIEKLAKIVGKQTKTIIGLMSGTSLDGLDIALCNIKNSGRDTELSLQNFKTVAYSKEFKESVKMVFAKRMVDQQLLCGLNAKIGVVHGQLILEALKQWNVDPNDVDLIASHGQTIYHAPQHMTGNPQFPNSTLQIGDGDHIAVTTGIITISDFRQKHLAASGEGAPLVVYGDYFLFSSEQESRILLNIGGIANLTYLPKASLGESAFATDIGPGNTIMNQYMQRYFDKDMDQDAQLALSGTPNRELLSALLGSPFLQNEFPATTGPEEFGLGLLETCLESLEQSGQLSHADILATLNSFTSEAIIRGIKRVAPDLENLKIYVSGGGLYNPMIMNNLRKSFPNAVFSFAELGQNPDAKEACLFAVLANETLSGDSTNLTNIKGAPQVCMGKISLPY